MKRKRDERESERDDTSFAQPRPIDTNLMNVDSSKTDRISTIHAAPIPAVRRNFLAQIPLLCVLNLSEDRLTALAAVLEERTYKDKSRIFTAGNASEYLYFLHTGKVNIRTSSGSHIVARLAKFDFFGESALLNAAHDVVVPHTKHAEAVGNVKVLVLARAHFELFFAENELFAFPRRQTQVVAAEKPVKPASHTPISLSPYGYSPQQGPELSPPTLNLSGVKEDGQPVRHKLSKEMTRYLLEVTKANMVFRGYSYKQRRALVRKMERREILKGEVVTTAGESGRYFFIVLSGRFQVHPSSPSAQQQHGMSLDVKESLSPAHNSESKHELLFRKQSQKQTVFTKGDCFGELALMYPGPATDTITAMEDSVVYTIDRFLFKSIARAIGQAEMRRLALFLKKVPLFATLASYERETIARALEEIKIPSGDIVYNEGDEADALYIVEHGSVILSTDEEKSDAVKRMDAEMNVSDEHAMEIAIINKGVGEYFGETSFHKGHSGRSRHSVTATAAGEDGYVVLMKLETVAVQLLLGPVAHILERSKQSLRTSVKIAKASSPGMFPRSPKPRGMGMSPGLSPRASPAGPPAMSLGGMPPPLSLGDSQVTAGPALSIQTTRSSPISPYKKHRITPAVPEFTLNSSSSSSSSSSASAADSSMQQQQQEKPVQFCNLQLVGGLGKGAFGIVALVLDKITGKTYALKCVEKSNVLDGHVGHILGEKYVMNTYKPHPFLMKLIATYKSEDWLYFLLEPSLGGDLFAICKQQLYCSEDFAKFYTACIVCGLEQLHNQNIIYRDLKLENVLIGSDGYIKLSDFGFAKQLRGPSDKTWTLCGTPAYLAPEIISGIGHGFACDWWALGILVFVILSRFFPFDDGKDERELYDDILHLEVKLELYFSQEAQDFVACLLEKNPLKRLGIIHGGVSLVKKHPWLTNIDWHALTKKHVTPPVLPNVSNELDLSNFRDALEENEDEDGTTDVDFGIPLAQRDVSDWTDGF